MEAKRPRLLSPVRYNRLPAPDTDLGTSPSYRGFSTRLVPRTNSQEWGLAQSAEVRAIHALEVIPENEQLVRTYHPALRHHVEVHVSHSQYGPEVWLLKDACEDTIAGGRAVHPYPGDMSNLYPKGILTPRSPWKEEFLFQDGINPRKLLSPAQLDGLREIFPTAVGARVLVTGFLVVLFKSLCDIQAVYDRDWVMEVGGLRTVYDKLRLEASADTLISGTEGSEQPESFHGFGCLGLRLRMADGTEAITTITHGFVKNPQPSRVTMMFADWFLRTKNSLSRFLRPPPQSEACATGVVRNTQGNSPVGKEVWVSMEKKRVGVISQTFDEPSSVLPFPAGYRHDLSLITDDNLPHLVSPPGYPVVSGWATYSAALAGSEVYAVRMHTVVGRWRVLEETVNPDAIRNTTVLGTQYLWNRQAQSQTASILWKTTEPSASAEGWSGSALCLGRPTDEHSQAIVFQNFQAHFVSSVSASNPLKRTDVIVKGGFLLPESIRSATIVTGDNQPRERNPFTYPRRSRDHTDPGRRVFSDL